MSISHQDWLVFARTIIFAAAIGLASLYVLEWNGSLGETHAIIWKKPKRWQLITLCILWSFIIAAFVMLLYFYDAF